MYNHFFQQQQRQANPHKSNHTQITNTNIKHATHITYTKNNLQQHIIIIRSRIIRKPVSTNDQTHKQTKHKPYKHQRTINNITNKHTNKKPQTNKQSDTTET